MNKKNYLKPETAQTVVVCDHSLLAGSLKFDGDGESGTGTLIDSDAEGDGLSRRYSIWDED